MESDDKQGISPEAVLGGTLQKLTEINPGKLAVNGLGALINSYSQPAANPAASSANTANPSYSVSSSWINGLDFDQNNETANWYFKDSRTFTTSMTKEELNDFLSASSKGRWYNANKK